MSGCRSHKDIEKERRSNGENQGIKARRCGPSDKLKEPRILTVGEPLSVAPPLYVKSFLKANNVDIPSVDSMAEAKVRVQPEIHDGADGIKIFANSIEQGTILTMPDELAKGIVEEAHAHGRPVFAHVSSNAGIESRRRVASAA